MHDTFLEQNTVTIVRCPKCGSTRAGANDGRSVMDLTFMECKGCGHSGLYDAFERDQKWTTAIALAPDEPIPALVAPLAEEWLDGGIAEMTEMTEVDVVPPRVFGCMDCYGNDPTGAWAASRVRRKLTPLFEDSHVAIRVSGCACGQNFVTVTKEAGDFVLPLTEPELDLLTSAPESLLKNLQTFGRDRRFLDRGLVAGGLVNVRWVPRGFNVG